MAEREQSPPVSGSGPHLCQGLRCEVLEGHRGGASSTLSHHLAPEVLVTCGQAASKVSHTLAVPHAIVKALDAEDYDLHKAPLALADSPCCKAHIP
jgi:hypothetical protein